MSKRNKKLSMWEHFLSKEIGVEFKACLYFFGILFFYSMYKLLDGIYEANIIHMAEMISLTYAMGYIQVYLLSNFDEGECLRVKECGYIMLCSLIYMGVSFLGEWFDRDITVSVGFFVYIFAMYVCVFLAYKYKRRIDEKLLNNDLQTFQERRKNEESNSD